MSLRRSYLSRRIIHLSFSLSKSCKESKSSEIESVCSSSNENQRGEEERKEGNQHQRRRDGVVSPEESGSGSGSWAWAWLLPELLGDIIQRVEASEDKWPERQNVVACGCVCKRWREITAEAVEASSIQHPDRITYPSSLKKAGPRDAPLQCIIKRDKKNATFHLYLALTPSFTDKGKFLFAARKYKNGARTEYIISLDPKDLSQGSKAYVGKLRLGFPSGNSGHPNKLYTSWASSVIPAV